MDWLKLAEIAAAVFGVLTAIVKFFPTVPTKWPWVLTIIKFLGNITNRQTDDAEVRATQK
jgi:hypothetical protein